MNCDRCHETEDILTRAVGLHAGMSVSYRLCSTNLNDEHGGCVNPEGAGHLRGGD